MGDPSRGYLLELMLTKLRYATAGISREDAAAGEGVQIIGMSATMPNARMVADWLGAELYQTNFRPVPLAKYIKVRHEVAGIGMAGPWIDRYDRAGTRQPHGHLVMHCNQHAVKLSQVAMLAAGNTTAGAVGCFHCIQKEKAVCCIGGRAAGDASGQGRAGAAAAAGLRPRGARPDGQGHRPHHGAGGRDAA